MRNTGLGTWADSNEIHVYATVSIIQGTNN